MKRKRINNEEENNPKLKVRKLNNNVNNNIENESEENESDESEESIPSGEEEFDEEDLIDWEENVETSFLLYEKDVIGSEKVILFNKLWFKEMGSLEIDEKIKYYLPFHSNKYCRKGIIEKIFIRKNGKGYINENQLYFINQLRFTKFIDSVLFVVIKEKRSDYRITIPASWIASNHCNDW